MIHDGSIIDYLFKSSSENAKLVQDVLNEVEMSRQSSETGYAPQHMSQQYNNPPQAYMSPQPQHLVENYGQNYTTSHNNTHQKSSLSNFGKFLNH